MNGGVAERTKMTVLRNSSKGNQNPGSVNCESGVLPQKYRAPHRLSELQNIDDSTTTEQK